MHRLRPARLAVVAFGLLVGGSGPAAFAKDIGTFSSLDGAWEATLATVPEADGQDPGLRLNRLVSMTLMLAPKGAPAGPPAPRPAPGSAVPAPAKPLVPGAPGSPGSLAMTAVTFDARMPGHSHGMVVQPKLTETTPGTWRVDGVKLHMAGAWELTVTGTAGGHPVKVTVPYQL